MEQRKWTAQPGLKKAQVEQLSKAISQVKRLGTTHIEIYGVIGGEEHRNEMATLFAPPRQEAVDALARLGEKYNYTVGPENLNAFLADAQVEVSALRLTIPVTDNRITQEEKDRTEAERKAEAEARDTLLESNLARAKEKMPSGAKALIVAELEQDDCNSMNDHYGTTCKRRVAIGWRFSAREDFRALHAAAESFPETVHLGPDAGKAVEHRDTYSGGEGNYLKAGGRYNSGWRVYSIEGLNHRMTGEWEFHLPETQAAAPLLSAGTNGGTVTVTLNQERNGVELRFATKPALEVLERIKSAGGWRWSRYSSCWYAHQTPETIAWAQDFAQSLS